AYGDVCHELRSDRAQAVQPRRLPQPPRVAHVAEHAQPAPVETEREMPERLPYQGERNAVLDTARSRPLAEQRAARVAAHGKITAATHGGVEAQGQHAGGHAPDAERLG